jgi:hypothetical protein
VLTEIFGVGETHSRLIAEAVATVEHALRRVANAIAIAESATRSKFIFFSLKAM